MYPDHRPHSRQVTEARYTEGAARQARAEYSSSPTTEAEQWPVRWLQCLIKKWSCVNSLFRLHAQVAYKPHIHDTWHKIQSHQFGQSILGDTRAPRTLPPMIMRLCSEDWCFIFWWLVLHMSTSTGSRVPYMVFVGAEVIDPKPFNTCGPVEDPLCHDGPWRWHGRS